MSLKFIVSPSFPFPVKAGQKRPINSPAPLSSNPHLAMSSNHLSAASSTQAVAGSAPSAGGASGSGPFASALRSLAIKADIKDEDGTTNESGGPDPGGVPSGTGDRGGYGGGGERSRDSSNQPANLSKHSSQGQRISVPQPQQPQQQQQDHHQRAMQHHSQQAAGDRDRGRVDAHLSDERKKKLSPPPEKVSYRFVIPSCQILFFANFDLI